MNARGSPEGHRLGHPHVFTIHVFTFHSPPAAGLQFSPMKYFYGEYDGEEFPSQDKLFGFDQVMQFIMQYGDQALKAIEQMMNNPKDGEQSGLLEQLLRDGMLDKDGKGKLRLT